MNTQKKMLFRMKQWPQFKTTNRYDEERPEKRFE